MSLTDDEFDACFDQARSSVFRLETLQRYTVAEEAERIEAFRRGEPRPDRSVRTSPWMRRIAATLVKDQQTSIIDRFPGTARTELVLLPAPLRNPHGTRPLPQHSFADAHRIWVQALPPLRLADGSTFDSTEVVPYSYRHSFAQRHADAGVPIDVLRDLMGHRSTIITQLYYKARELHRAGEKPQVASSARVRNGGERPAAEAA